MAARTNLPLSVVTAAGIADPAGTTIDQANGMNIAMVSEAIPPAYDAYRGLMLRVANTGTTGNVIVRKGVNPPAMRADLGDLNVSVTTSTTKELGPFDMARHAQSDDSINIDFASGFTGTITAFILGRNVG
jgi:hypothetical protein